MKKTALTLFAMAAFCQSLGAAQFSNQREFDLLMSMDATYSCSAVCIGYQNSGNVDEKKMVEYGSFENCGTAEAPVACLTVHSNNSVNIRHSMEELRDNCWKNGFALVISTKSKCDVVSTRQECSNRPEDQGKPVGLICKDLENWRKPLKADLIRKGLISVGAKLVD